MNGMTAHLGILFDRVYEVSLKAGVLAALILILQLVLRDRLQPKWHYWLWLLVFARLALPWGPESEFSLYHWLGFTAGNGSVDVPEPFLEHMPFPDAATTSTGHPLYRYLLIGWLVGACALAAHTFRINRRFARRVRNASAPVTDARALNVLRRCQTLMRVRRTIALAETRTVATPTLIGTFRPMVLMPAGLLDRLSDDELQYVFLHELAHCKRWDIAVNWFLQALLIVHWFNPLLWYAARRLHEDQELACDALALGCLPEDRSREYGHTLIKMLEQLSRPATIAGNVRLIGHQSQMQRRIVMIKQYQARSYRWSIAGIALLLLLSGCVLTNPKSDDKTQLSSDTTVSASPTPSGNPSSSPTPTPTPTPTPSSGTSPDSSLTPAVNDSVKPSSDSAVSPSTGNAPSAPPTTGDAAAGNSQPAIRESKPPTAVPAGDQEATLLPASVSAPQPVAERPRNAAGASQGSEQKPRAEGNAAAQLQPVPTAAVEYPAAPSTPVQDRFIERK